MRQFSRLIVSIVAWATLVGVVLGYGGAVVFQLDTFAHFRMHFLYVALAVGLIATGLRHWRAMANLGAAGLLAIAGLGVFWEEPRRPGDGVEITVMTANLLHPNPMQSQMIDALVTADADILVTQETHANVLAEPSKLVSAYPHRLVLNTTRQSLRTVLWSKFPMHEGTLFLEDRIEPSGARAIIEVADGVDLGVLGLHFSHTLDGYQDVQISALADISANMPSHRVVMGDLNTTPWSWGMLRTEALTGTTRIGGYRETWHGDYKTPFGTIPAMLGHAIDHVLVSSMLGVSSVRMVDIPGSDHMAVVAVLHVPADADAR